MSAHFFCNSKGLFQLGKEHIRCALGEGGVTPAADKREGDGASPIGVWPMRRVHYRSDRIERPETALAVRPIAPDDGWCDAPGHDDYNRLVRLPHPASCERMWREDPVYDMVVELGYNDDPVAPGRGSAIFLHVAHADYRPTEGCVALSPTHLLEVLRTAGRASTLEIAP